MRSVDELIDEALDAEERELLRSIGNEPGYFSQVWGIFGGSLGWVNWLLAIVQGVMFLIGVWAAWHFFAATEVLDAIRWGFGASVLLILSALLKLTTLWPSLQTNRVLRELKRVELQLARAGRG